MATGLLQMDFGFCLLIKWHTKLATLSQAGLTGCNLAIIGSEPSFTPSQLHWAPQLRLTSKILLMVGSFCAIGLARWLPAQHSCNAALLQAAHIVV